MQILLEALDKKIEILEKLQNYCIKQEEIITEEMINWDAFNQNVDDKAELIEELSRLDDGFEMTFERRKEDLLVNQDKYRSEITMMQDKIRTITDLSTELQKQEYRNKSLIEKAFSDERTRIKEQKRSSKVAMDYYQRMNKVNYIDPQLMDRKS